VSIDAIGCQKEIVELIVGKEADYLIGLKENQDGLREQVADCGWAPASQCQLAAIWITGGPRSGRSTCASN
jgi:hypothetical protein